MPCHAVPCRATLRGNRPGAAFCITAVNLRQIEFGEFGSGSAKNTTMARTDFLQISNLPLYQLRHTSLVKISILDTVLTILYYNILSYAVLCCVVLCCAVLCCAVLCCALLFSAVLCCAVLGYAMLCYAMLCYAMLCYTILYYTILYYTMHILYIYIPTCTFQVQCLCHPSHLSPPTSRSCNVCHQA